MNSLEKLAEIRRQTNSEGATTLSDEQIKKFIEDDDLIYAIRKAYDRLPRKIEEFPEGQKLNEQDFVNLMRNNVLNFYSLDAASTFVPLASEGPWIITYHGGVIYDVGGYGMLGFGQNPRFLKQAFAKDQTMANIMTANLSQYRFTRALMKAIGINRDSCPYDQFAFMNSGSEAVSVAARISDAHAKVMTDSGVKHQGQQIKFLALQGSFHGRTYRAALASSSTSMAYQQLASFRDEQKLITVEPNNLKDLENKFKEARLNNIYIESMFMEPVMGEGRAGYAITPEFYQLARKLTQENDALLLVDSVQAGLRTHGLLSIVDYPGFEKLEAPDFEVFSKAVNAGQFPMSVIALTDHAASFYKQGIYGNTMTGNPRALDLGTAVVEYIDQDVRSNIVDVGNYFKQELLKLQKEFPDIITEVLGQGLLLSAQLAEEYKVVGLEAVEYQIRRKGFNVIHSSGNRLRFTPWFLISEEEVDLMIEVMQQVFKKL